MRTALTAWGAIAYGTIAAAAVYAIVKVVQIVRYLRGACDDLPARDAAADYYGLHPRDICWDTQAEAWAPARGWKRHCPHCGRRMVLVGGDDPTKYWCGDCHVYWRRDDDGGMKARPSPRPDGSVKPVPACTAAVARPESEAERGGVWPAVRPETHHTAEEHGA